MDETARKQIGDNLRFYSDARFKQLTLFLSWITLLAAGLFQFEDKLLAKELNVRLAIPAFAMFVTAVFWVMEIRATLNWRAHRDSSPDLWPRPPADIWSWLNATHAVFILYAGIYATWFKVATMQGASSTFTSLAASLGIVVLVFGIHTYAAYSKQGSTLPRKDG